MSLSRLWAVVMMLMSAVAIVGATVPISYHLPYTPGQTKTYRVTLAITKSDNPDWILSTFLTGAVRTVNDSNQGQFTDTWNGLDENRMPLPPGTYGVKGVYMAGSTWSMDQQTHSFTANYILAAADSWAPSKGQGVNAPHIFGSGATNMEDIQVGANGTASFVSRYGGGAPNLFLADLTRANGYDQVVGKYDNDNFGPVGAVATDGEYSYVNGRDTISGNNYLYRHDKYQWGPVTCGTTNVRGYQLDSSITVPSMVAWKRTGDNARFVYVAQTNTSTSSGSIVTYNGEAASVLGTSTAVTSLTAVTLDRQTPGNRLYALYMSGSSWVVGWISLSNGIPTGNWTNIFTVPTTIANPVDMDMDTQGYFYLVSTTNNAVYRVNSSGTIVQTLGGSAQVAGSYNTARFMSPQKVTTWKDGSTDKVLILEAAGPKRVSEWQANGTLLRQWFFFHDANKYGYCADPADPTKLYAVASQSATNKGLIRYSINYDTGAWTVDAVWPDICTLNSFVSHVFPDGQGFPRIINYNNNKYLTFDGWWTSWGPSYSFIPAYMIYRISGTTINPSVGVSRPTTYPVRCFWRDQNGDGLAQNTEYYEYSINGNIANIAQRSVGDFYSNDLSLLVPGVTSVYRNTPQYFDTYGNPSHNGYSGWTEKLIDFIYRARQTGIATLFTGGNEVATAFGDMDIDGSTANGYYIADSSGDANPYGWGTVGQTTSQFKLSRYVPNGQNGYDMKWRVGRKAITVAEPGEVYQALHTVGPVNGIVAVADRMGLIHLYSEDGLYLDTLMLDPARTASGSGGMYLHGEDTTMPPQLVAHNGKTYLLWNRTALGVYEIDGLTSSAVQAITNLPTTITLAPASTNKADWFAVQLRGGFGQTHVMKSTPAPTVTLPLDGAFTGWDVSGEPMLIAADTTRTVEMRAVNDDDHLYLRLHVRQPDAFTPGVLNDPTELFTHAAGHTTVSMYLRGDVNQTSLDADGETGDVRLVFALVNDAGTTRVVCLGIYPTWTFAGTPTPKSYTGASGTVSFAHVGLMNAVQTGYRLDADGKGFVIGAKIPRANVLPMLDSLANVKTLVDFEATFAGTSKAWWANTMKPEGATTTNDVAAEARFYPSAWGQGQLSAGLTPPTQGLYAWLRPESLMGSEFQPVSAWTDSSGSNLSFSHTINAEKPVYRWYNVNGWNSAAFDGVNDQLYCTPTTAHTGPAAVFAYGQCLTGQPDDNPYTRILSAVSSTGGFDYETGLHVTPYDASVLSPRIFEQVATDTRTLSQIGLGQRWESVSGRSTTYNSAWRGDLSEVLLYSQLPDMNTVQEIRDYYRSKFSYPPTTFIPSSTVPTNGLQFWLKANAITGVADGSSLSSWSDSSGNCRPATQATGEYQPKYIASSLNGQPGVRFDGQDDFALIDYSTSSTEITYIAAFATRNTDANGSILGMAKNEPNGWFYNRNLGISNGFPSYEGTDAGTMLDGPISINDNNVHILTMKYNSEGIRLYIDGVLQAYDSDTELYTYSDYTVLLGAGPMGYINADYGDVLVYDRGLTTSELAQVTKYLQDKYLSSIDNLPPTVSITKPGITTSTSFAAGSSFPLVASAADTDGTIAKVEFYQGTTKLGEKTSAPYEFLWVDVPAGTYALTAKAYDDNGATTTSVPVNIFVGTIPQTGLALWLDAAQGVSVTDGKVTLWVSRAGIVAATPSPGGENAPGYDSTAGPSATPVVTFNGNQKLAIANYAALNNMAGMTWFIAGKGSNGPLFDAKNQSCIWRTKVAPTGDYQSEAGIPNFSSNITHGADTGFAVYALRYESLYGILDAWKNNGGMQHFDGPNLTNTGVMQQLALGAATDWTANGDGMVGEISEILVYNRILNTGEVDIVRSYLQSKYHGAVGTIMPTCTVTAPTSATTITSNSNYTITVNASDNDGSIAKVEFFQGATKLGEDTSSPYTFTWNNISAGSYSITAKATDDDGNITTSSAVTISVADVPTNGLSMWLKADAITGLSNGSPVATWTDSSSAANNATAPTTGARPTYVTNAVNGKPIVRFDGTNAWLRFTPITDVRTVFWVLNEDTDAAGWAFLFGAQSSYDFHRNYKNFWGGWTSSAITNGTTRVNGVAINGTTTTVPTNMAIISLRTTGNVTAGNFTFDREANYSKWDGDVAEVLVYNRALTDTEIAEVEMYLNAKYAITNLPPSCSITAPTDEATFSAGANVIINATASDSNGSVSKVEFYQGATKLGEDTTSPYSYTWTAPADGYYTLTAKATDNQSTVTTSTGVSITVGNAPQVPTDGMLMWVKADAITGLNNGDPVATWTDSSTAGNNLTQSTSSYRPTYVTNALNGKPVVRFDGADDRLNFTQQSTVRTVFWVGKEDTNATNAYRPFIGDTNYYYFHRGESKNIWGFYTQPEVTGGLTRLNAATVNGSTTLMPTNYGVLAFRTTANVYASLIGSDRNAYMWDGDMAEVLIYNRALTDTEISNVESYLMSKYGL